MATPATEQQRHQENGGGEMGEGEGEGDEEEEEGEMEKRAVAAAGIQSFMKNHSNSALLDVEPPVRLPVMSFV